MANIKITVEGPLMDGHKITFKAPCNCDVVEKLDVRYIENNTQKSILFTMKDSHGNDLTGLGNLFFKDAYVDVVLDPNSGSAYLQNAGTNAYLEEKFKTAVSVTPVDNLESDRADLPLSARQGKILNDSLEWKLHQTITAKDTEYNLPTSFKELLVVGILRDGAWKLPLNIPYIDLSTSLQQYFAGLYVSDTLYAHIGVKVTKTKISMTYGGDANTVKTFSTKVYYR